MKLECTDSRFEVRPVHPSEFEIIYDLVDSAFGEKRDRRSYDWIYRDNPCGIARCLILIEKSSGDPVWVSGVWPWPTARGTSELLGSVSGDLATAPHLQRKYIFGLTWPFFREHPYYTREVLYGWPNSKTVNWLKNKIKRTDALIGPFPRFIFYLRSRSRTRLARRGWPPALAGVAGVALDGWQALLRSGSDMGDLRVEESIDPIAVEKDASARSFGPRCGAAR